MLGATDRSTGLKRVWLIPATLLCALLLVAVLYSRLNDVAGELRIAILIASVLMAAGMVWFVGRSSGPQQ